ncbi:MAG: nucleoside kinase [Anaerovoracaceae bacterium]|jgi:uridine kinase
MKIELKLSQDHQYKTEEVEPGITIEEVYRRHQDELELPVISARRDHKIEDMTSSLDKPCKLELVDIRDQAAKLMYQHSLTLAYLKAVEDVMGRVEVEIMNSLGNGLYTEIRSRIPVTAEQISRISDRMHEMVAEDIPYKRIVIDREEGVRLLAERGLFEKIRLIEASPEVKELEFYSLDGFVNFFYGLMVPSTGYLYDFEVRKYKNGVMLRHPHVNSPRGVPEFKDDRKLYAAFHEIERWHDMQDIHFVMDLNDKLAAGETRGIILLSEALHQKNLVEIASDIMKQKKRIILIAGPSSSGKTTFARKLCIQLMVGGLKPVYMGTDDYFVEREDTPKDEHGDPDYEDLQAVDVDLFNRQMNDLLEGKEVDLPTFNFMTGHKEYGRRRMKLNRNQPIIIEGIHALNDKLTPLIHYDEKYRIYISPLTPLNIDMHNRISETDARMLRRLVRDNKYRGHSAAETIRTWPKVRAGEDKNIFPYNSKADVFFNSAHIYELGVLKKYAVPLLQEITPDQEEYSEAVRMLQFLRFFRTIDADEMISNESILREFIGGSIFVD